jgi:alpha/beta superfamily hydrolase
VPVIVIPGADHFFHRKLGHIKSWVIALWHGQKDTVEPV